jgi:hypothetical protein
LNHEGKSTKLQGLLATLETVSIAKTNVWTRQRLVWFQKGIGKKPGVEEISVHLASACAVARQIGKLLDGDFVLIRSRSKDMPRAAVRLQWSQFSCFWINILHPNLHLRSVKRALSEQR